MSFTNCLNLDKHINSPSTLSTCRTLHVAPVWTGTFYTCRHFINIHVFTRSRMLLNAYTRRLLQLYSSTCRLQCGLGVSNTPFTRWSWVDERSSTQLVEPASSCKRAIRKHALWCHVFHSRVFSRSHECRRVEFGRSNCEVLYLALNHSQLALMQCFRNFRLQSCVIKQTTV